ncbi:hypothetical protein KJ742_03370 [Patescibacteria group bacterium]|nr:hypothetical protein [Patescibacteria group bacterium]MBU1682960.1 hypothetical protein [Patescibacteria group bacterium]MBU1934872.1 hypothetical protein [Patescibacteria group bacterium]
MTETGDAELFTGPAAREQDEKSDEQFREEMRRIQQALQQLYQEEGKARVHDNNLVQIILQFLNQADSTDLFLLISRAVAQDIPSELIIAIISLIDQKASKEIKGLLESSERQETPQEASLAIKEHRNFQSLSSEQKSAVDSWIKLINDVATKKPHKCLESIVIKKRSDDPASRQLVREVSPVLTQLSAFILRNFLTSQKVTFELESLQEFMQAVFVNLIKNLEELVEGQKKIEKY